MLAIATYGNAATTVPVQLLNPAGSSSGQTIVSTGASSAPGWATVPLSGISSIAANTVVTNASSASASPSAFAMPSCSGASAALEWTTNAGFNCNVAINAAQLNGQTFTAPTITTPNITGVTNGSNSTGGSVGEYPAGNASATSMTSVTPAQCAGVTLTAGDWDVWGNIQFSPAAGTTVAEVLSGINVGSVALPGAQNYQLIQGSLTTGGQQVIAAPMQRVSISTSTNVYLIGYASFGISTMQCSGWIQARRIR